MLSKLPCKLLTLNGGLSEEALPCADPTTLCLWLHLFPDSISDLKYLNSSDYQTMTRFILFVYFIKNTLSKQIQCYNVNHI